MRALAPIAFAAVALTGCSLGGDDESGRGQSGSAIATGPEVQGGKVKPGEPPEAAAIRGWSDAVNARQYDRAGSFFARNAIVDQGQAVRLPDRSAAVAFSKSLPCKATVTDIKKDGRTIVAAFDLRPGTGPRRSCDGAARVRFRFSGNKFTEWRQLADPQAAPGQSV